MTNLKVETTEDDSLIVRLSNYAAWALVNQSHGACSDETEREFAKNIFAAIENALCDSRERELP